MHQRLAPLVCEELGAPWPWGHDDHHAVGWAIRRLPSAPSSYQQIKDTWAGPHWHNSVCNNKQMVWLLGASSLGESFTSNVQCMYTLHIMRATWLQPYIKYSYLPKKTGLHSPLGQALSQNWSSVHSWVQILLDAGTRGQEGWCGGCSRGWLGWPPSISIIIYSSSCSTLRRVNGRWATTTAAVCRFTSIVRGNQFVVQLWLDLDFWKFGNKF